MWVLDADGIRAYVLRVSCGTAALRTSCRARAAVRINVVSADGVTLAIAGAGTPLSERGACISSVLVRVVTTSKFSNPKFRSTVASLTMAASNARHTSTHVHTDTDTHKPFAIALGGAWC